MENKQYKSTLFIGRRTLHTLALLLIVHCSLLIVNCPNPFIRSVLEPKTVTFYDLDSYSYNGRIISTQEVYKGYPAKRPSTPPKAGHTFDAWYTDTTYLQMWDFNSIITENRTLYANWFVNDTGILLMNGQPVPNDIVKIRNGEKLDFTTVADFSYQVNDFYDHHWTLNGADVGYTGQTSYTFDTSQNDKEPGKNYVIGLKVRKTDNRGITKDYFASVTVRIMYAKMTIRSQPTKLTYNNGDTLDLSGLVVRLTYENNSTDDVAFSAFATKNITVSPAHGTLLTSAHNGEKVTVYYGNEKLPIDDPITISKGEQRPDENETINISWDNNDVGEISFDTTGQPLLNNTVTLRKGESVTFSVVDSYDDYQWKLNGADIVPAPSPKYEYTFDTSDNDKETGRSYGLMLIVRKGTDYFTIEITVKVEA